MSDYRLEELKNYYVPKKTLFTEQNYSNCIISINIQNLQVAWLITASVRPAGQGRT